MNKFLDKLIDNTNFAYTENGAVTHTTTKSALLDMFALGGAYRDRSEEDVIVLFDNALKEDPLMTLKCLFYLRDIRGGQGERRFFKVCIKWLAIKYPQYIINNIEQIPYFGRWDDLFVLFDTKAKTAALNLIKYQLAYDVQSKTPSLLAKWLPSENTSSEQTIYYGNIIRKFLKMSHKEYRKVLSVMRERIRVLERLMSTNRWDEIEFDKIPSRAGIIYRNAFAENDITKARYEQFTQSVTTKVNAKTLYPYECVYAATKLHYNDSDAQRAIVNKYWENLTDYFKNATFNGLAIVDTSGSMFAPEATSPINVATSLGLYCAEHARGPFANYFMTFSSTPVLQKVEGIDFVDKVRRITNANWGSSTNIEAAFDLLLTTAIQNNCAPEDLPQNLIVISDMEFNEAVTSTLSNTVTLFEAMKFKWEQYGYKMPKLIFWNVSARNNNIPMYDDGEVNYVSGFSPVLYEQIMKNLSAYDIMMDKLNSDRYNLIKI